MRVIDLPVPHEDGSFVSAKISRLIELIQEYDPTLEVRWIPPAARHPGDAAFAIVELTRDGPRTAFLVQNEEDMDERILARIIQGDARHHDPKIRIENMERAQKLVKAKEQAEIWEQAEDEAKFLLRTPLHRVQVGKNKFLNL